MDEKHNPLVLSTIGGFLFLLILLVVLCKFYNRRGSREKGLRVGEKEEEDERGAKGLGVERMAIINVHVLR